MLHVYAIIDAERIACAVPQGHGGAELTAVPATGLAAVVSRASGDPAEASLAHVWHHESILSALMRRHAVLPMRFGTMCTPQELSAGLGGRRDALWEALRQVAGRVEMAVRISAATAWGEDAECRRAAVRPGGSPGTAYLLARSARQRQVVPVPGAAARAVGDLKDGLEQLSVETVWRVPAAADQPFKASCLIARDAQAGFVAAVETLAARQSAVAVSCTGPWAPYSFVGACAMPSAGQ